MNEQEVEFLLTYYKLLSKYSDQSQRFVDQLNKLVVMGEISRETASAIKAMCNIAGNLPVELYKQLMDLAYSIGNAVHVDVSFAGEGCQIEHIEEGDPCHPRCYDVCRNLKCCNRKCPMHYSRYSR